MIAGACFHVLFFYRNSDRPPPRLVKQCETIDDAHAFIASRKTRRAQYHVQLAWKLPEGELAPAGEGRA